MSVELKIGDLAPQFMLLNQEEESVSLSKYKGQWIILYFYPKDNTPGCTTEACEFTGKRNDFEGLGAKVIGISKDTVKSHKNFIIKQDLEIELLSDPETKVNQQYGVWQLKKNYGKEYYGTVRTTFLINPEQKIAYIWNKVKVKGHVDNVFEVFKEKLG